MADKDSAAAMLLEKINNIGMLINSLDSRISGLENKIREIERITSNTQNYAYTIETDAARHVRELEERVNSITSSIPTAVSTVTNTLNIPTRIGSNGSYTIGASSIPVSISDVASNDDGTLTVTYSDGREATIRI